MKKAAFSFFGFIAASALCFTSCKQNQSTSLFNDLGISSSSNSYSSWHLQPYGDFTKAEAERIVEDIKRNMPILEQEKNVQITILEPRQLPSMAYSKTYGRYRADSLLSYESRVNTDKDIVLMGLTHKDISTTIHGQKDFGIIGYSLCPGRSSVVSTYRIARREDAWKTVVHEFFHTQGVPHCPNDDPSCIMCDAKGQAPKYSQKKGLCHDCATKARLPINDESVKYIK